MSRTRLSYANVVSTLALFLAVAGGTTAVALSGKNNVDKNDIQKGAVDGREVKNESLFARDLGNGSVDTSELQGSSVTGGKVVDATVLARDLGTGSVAADELAAGAVTGAAVADGSLGTADIDESSLFNDNSLTGLDIAEGTLYNDDSLNAADIDEASLPFQAGNGATSLTGGEVPVGEEVETAIPSGTLTFDCGGTPGLTYSNTGGATTEMFETRRDVVFEDDGIAGNGQVTISHNDVTSGNSHAVSVSGAGALGRSEVAIITPTHLVWAKIFAFGVSPCSYVMELTVEPI